MHARLLAALAAVAPLVAAEDILGAYVFHRHGDRTAKVLKHVKLTDLGAEEAFSSGDFYRSRYLSSGSKDATISGLSQDAAVLSQLAITSPIDAVLHGSAQSFLQGLYPPVGGKGELLANGSHVPAPLGGYQYIPIAAVDEDKSPDHPENDGWLQGNSGCTKAVDSSNSYLASSSYENTKAGSKDFYQSLMPVINSTFDEGKATYQNAYTIFDYVNVATIHNSSIPSKVLLTDGARNRLFSLASTHEWNLAYNASEPVRAIAGSVLAGQIVTALDALVSGKDAAPKLNVQFGAYGTFMAFFGLANLPKASNDFYGIVDYASSMAFELVVPDASSFKPDDVSVRFLFANGTAAHNELKAFPLFGQDKTDLSWNDFKSGMNKFAVADTKSWCGMCGVSGGSCSADGSDGGDDNAAASSSSSGGNGVSKPVAGVIGALVTLVVVLGIQAAVMLFGGLRLVKKSSLGRATPVSETAGEK